VASPHAGPYRRKGEEMGRKLGSKNKKKELVVDSIEPESMTEAPVFHEVTGTVEQPCKMVVMKGQNPLIGYTLDEIRGFVDEINPKCARGGCLHPKSDHFPGNNKPTECHNSGCNCIEFLI
jgi:hypothetical protein